VRVEKLVLVIDLDRDLFIRLLVQAENDYRVCALTDLLSDRIILKSATRQRSTRRTSFLVSVLEEALNGVSSMPAVASSWGTASSGDRSARCPRVLLIVLHTLVVAIGATLAEAAACLPRSPHGKRREAAR
jgi:hypothetical protein